MTKLSGLYIPITGKKIEADQIERLKQIFKLVKAGKGYRIVKFSNDIWVNCWDMPDPLDAKISIDRLEWFIRKVDPGD